MNPLLEPLKETCSGPKSSFPSPLEGCLTWLFVGMLRCPLSVFFLKFVGGDWVAIGALISTRARIWAAMGVCCTR